jgi:hypothetical protein
MKKWQVSLLLLIIVIIFSSLIFVSFWSGIKWLSVFSPLSLTLLIPYLQKEIKRIAKEIHNKDTPKSLYEKGKEEFADYIELKGIVEPIQFGYLIELIDKNVQDLKAPFFINRGVIAAILAPIWIQYITYIFTRETNSFEEATVILFSLIFLISILLFFISIGRTIVDDILNSEYNRMKKMNNLVRDIYLIKLSEERTVKKQTDSS